MRCDRTCDSSWCALPKLRAHYIRIISSPAARAGLSSGEPGGGNANLAICGESDRLLENGPMKKNRLLLLWLASAMAAAFAAGVHGEATDEIARLAELMGWKAGTVAADIGAGDGKYTFAAVDHVGTAGKGDAAGSDREKLGG